MAPFPDSPQGIAVTAANTFLPFVLHEWAGQFFSHLQSDNRREFNDATAVSKMSGN